MEISFVADGCDFYSSRTFRRRIITTTKKLMMMKIVPQLPRILTMQEFGYLLLSLSRPLFIVTDVLVICCSLAIVICLNIRSSTSAQANKFKVTVPVAPRFTCEERLERRREVLLSCKNL